MTTEAPPIWRSRIIGHGEEAPDQLLAHPQNWRIHPKGQQDALAAVLDRVGWVQDVIVNQRTGHVLDGHLRVSLAISRSEPSIPVVYVDLSEEEERTVLATFDPISAMAAPDSEILTQLIEDIGAEQGMLDELLKGIAAQVVTLPVLDPLRPPAPTLADRFLLPPFSVLDARQGYWQNRKRQWLSLGIQSEVGRGDNLLHFSERANDQGPGGAARKRARGLARSYGQDLMKGEHTVGEQGEADVPGAGTSIFDPVLCEVAYRWFSPVGGAVLDPFAGGSVRGITASILGRMYTGVDLSPEQIAANRQQAADIVPDSMPTWAEGDATDVRALAAGEYDMILSCPPYANLEVYSDDPRDLSTMAYPAFLKAYRKIISECCAMLKPDRFACFVVGDVRDSKGNYRSFPGDTIRAFEDAGLKLYNDAILVTAVGSLPIRAAKQFTASRKLGKTHQNVLVFVKGDARRAVEACGQIEIEDPAAMFGELV